MLSANKIEEIKNYSHKEFWERLQQLNQATQNTQEEEAELILLREEVFRRKKTSGCLDDRTIPMSLSLIETT